MQICDSPTLFILEPGPPSPLLPRMEGTITPKGENSRRLFLRRDRTGLDWSVLGSGVFELISLGHGKKDSEGRESYLSAVSVGSWLRPPQLIRPVLLPERARRRPGGRERAWEGKREGRLKTKLSWV